MEQALAGPLAAERDMVISMKVPGGALRGVGLPIRVAGFRPAYRPPPLLGEHTEQVLGGGKSEE